MNNSYWTTAIKGSADPSRATHALELLAATKAAPALEAASAEEARIVTAVLSGSQALTATLTSHPEFLQVLSPDSLRYARRRQGIRKEVDHLLQPLIQAGDYVAALRQLRVVKSREMLRIGARDLARLAAVVEITHELSDLADVCLEIVWSICARQMEARLGRPFHKDPDGRWQPTTSCILGLGKLGGQELNYSSDVDLMFVYADEGGVFRVPPGKAKSAKPVLPSHQFFNRLAEAFITEATRTDAEGMLYRIDMRLRPEGDAGPLCRSLAGYENYYAQWGQTWERMMLIKARGVAGESSLAAEFLEMVQPFRYPRSINQSVLHEVATMKDRIELEVVKAGEIDRNVKLGRGGIREVEFVVQSMQLLHAGRLPFLQGSQTLPCLEKLVDYQLLGREEAKTMAQSYCFLRDVEHRLQMEDNRQTHTIPEHRPAQERLARLMGFPGSREFEQARKSHASGVRKVFERVLKSDSAEEAGGSRLPAEFEGRENDWCAVLQAHAFRDPAKAFRVLREFVEGPGYVHVSPRTRELAYQLLPRLLGLCPGGGRHRALSSKTKTDPLRNIDAPLSDPDRVATRLDSFISAYGARATLFELWHSNPLIFELLILLFDRSEFLAELAIRTPDLVDELVTSDRLRQRKSAEETLSDLRHGLGDSDQYLWLRRYHQAELMRIGLRDILGLIDPEQYLTELSALADACLRYALEAVMHRRKLKVPPFAIIGLGKLGGAEIDYGSDLDIVFVSEKHGSLARTCKLAVEVMDLMSKRTEHGVLFQTDARLRPDGEKGLLVNSLKAYEEYYRSRAQLWEIQSLTRTRGVAGDSQVAGKFQALAGLLSNFARPSQPLCAYAPDWKQRIHQMRMRIEKERTPRGKEELAIKTGAGGLMDAEFIAQAICLEQGWQEPNTVKGLERAQCAGVLADAGLLITNYRRLRRVEGILRRWSYEGEVVLPDDPAPYYRVAIRCGFRDADAFRSAILDYRGQIRSAYRKVFPF